MKKIFSLLCAAIITCSCQSQSSYIINGKVKYPGLEGKQVVLVGNSMNREAKWSDTSVVVNGKYQFTGKIDKPAYSRIYINHADRQNFVYVNLLVENATITVTTDKNKKSVVSGSKNNESLQKYLDDEQALFQRRNDSFPVLSNGWMDLTPEQKEALSSDLFAKFTNEFRVLLVNFLKENINNPAGLSQVNKIRSFPLEQLKAALSNANEETLKNPEVAEIAECAQALENTSVGKPFIDLHMADPEGKKMAISDYAGKGKYVFVDFWASWCAPCRAEKPNELAAYKKYKDKGFEIVGISFDNNREAWTKAIKELGLTWPQMSDLQNGTEARTLYGIVGIPHSVLLDKEGIIIAKNLRGEGLEKKLGEIFGE